MSEKYWQTAVKIDILIWAEGLWGREALSWVLKDRWLGESGYVRIIWNVGERAGTLFGSLLCSQHIKESGIKALNDYLINE